MSSTMKISLLALASTAAAVPQNGYGHSRFHSYKPSGTEGYGYETAPAQPYGTAPAQSYGHDHSHSQYGTGKPYPYPTGGYPMGRNSTHVHPHPTGSYGQGQASTIDVTSTSTTTVIKTVHVSPSPAGGNYQSSAPAVAQAVSTGGYDQCGPATVTVTASERVTVTVEGGYSASAAAVSSKPAQGGYSASAAAVSSKPAQGGYSASAAAVSSKPAQGGYSASAAAVSSKPAQGGYSASAPQPAQPTSSKAVAPVYSSAAPSAAPSSAPSTGSYSGSKRGVAYNDAGLLKSIGGKFGFAYNWGQTENADIGTMYIPMMHKPSDSTPEAWLANVDAAVKKGSTAVMGFNECDISSECGLSPADACSAWKQYMNPVKAKYPALTVIGPSVTNSGGDQAATPGQGLDWLNQFHSVCPDAAVDATNIHFYSIYQDKTNTQYSTTMDRLQAQVEAAAKNYGKKVWLTEYGLNAGSATADQAAQFLKDSLTYLDGCSDIQGYSYYMVGTDQSKYELCEGDGPSSLGQLYAGAS